MITVSLKNKNAKYTNGSTTTKNENKRVRPRERAHGQKISGIQNIIFTYLEKSIEETSIGEGIRNFRRKM